MENFLFEKEYFTGLLKIICIQKKNVWSTNVQQNGYSFPYSLSCYKNERKRKEKEVAKPGSIPVIFVYILIFLYRNLINSKCTFAQHCSTAIGFDYHIT